MSNEYESIIPKGFFGNKTFEGKIQTIREYAEEMNEVELKETIDLLNKLLEAQLDQDKLKPEPNGMGRTRFLPDHKRPDTWSLH